MQISVLYKNRKWEQRLVAHGYSPNTQKSEAGGLLWVWCDLRYTMSFRSDRTTWKANVCCLHLYREPYPPELTASSPFSYLFFRENIPEFSSSLPNRDAFYCDCTHFWRIGFSVWKWEVAGDICSVSSYYRLPSVRGVVWRIPSDNLWVTFLTQISFLVSSYFSILFHTHFLVSP